jgi:hypothetical protein
MSFVGDLEHLPIVDVIQLLHSTRKSGTLCLNNPKGESQLVFVDGYIVSANHLNNSVRIGQILVDMKAISNEELEITLNEQKSAGNSRTPLIAALIESGKIRKEDAFRGLESLIEMTIVEVLTWTSGTFSLDVDKIVVSDEYRYFPEKLHEDFHLNTQNILMDSLRIYDEKMRDGTLSYESLYMDEPIEESRPEPVQESQLLSADDLGLGDFDSLERKIPDVFHGLKHSDPREIHRQKIGTELLGIPLQEQEKLYDFLVDFSENNKGGKLPAGCSEAVILFSRKEFINHTIKTVCKHDGYFVFTTDEEENLDLIIDQSLSKDLSPVLVIDAPAVAEGGFSEEYVLSLITQKLDKYPQLSVLQLVSPQEFDFPLKALQSGARTVIPRPVTGSRDSFAANTIMFLNAFRAYVKKSFPGPDQEVLRQFKDCMIALTSFKEPPDVSNTLLQFASLMFERCITFVVTKTELIAERGVGIKPETFGKTPQPVSFQIPLLQPSVFHEVLDTGQLFFGQSNDPVLKNHLYAEIGAPLSSKIMIVPIKIMGRVAALTYGDFGPKKDVPVHPGLLAFLAKHAGLVLDNTLYRKKLENPGQSN